MDGGRTGFAVERDVMIPARDGVRLASDVWRPVTDRAGPTLLLRTPYGKDRVLEFFGFPQAPDLLALLEAGYVVVIQDCRGRYRSQGEFTPLVDEAHDGADTIAWITRQEWSDGIVGMFGGSYHGYTQWAAHASGMPGPQAIAASVSSPDFHLAPFYSSGGALSWHFMLTWGIAGLDHDRRRDRAIVPGASPLHATDLHPSAASLQGAWPGDSSVLAALPTWYRDIVARPTKDGFWQELSVLDEHPDLRPPSLLIGGWFDIMADATTLAYSRLSAPVDGAGSVARRLVIGPWTHTDYSGSYPELDFAASGGAADRVSLTAEHIRFFDHVLRGGPALDAAPVSLFVMGENRWRDELDWPLPDTRYSPYYLTSSGRAATSLADGVLSVDPPVEENEDDFAYDPGDPVPTLGGRVMAPSMHGGCGPSDQTVIEARDDVVTYSTAPFTEPLEVTGPIRLVLHVTSSARDTDFTAKVVDVHPDGRALYLTDGILRMRYRNGLQRPRPIHPGTVYEVMIDVGATSNVFLPGHRLRLEISSSNFPRYDRNPNTGDFTAPDAGELFITAHNCVLTGPDHLSHMILPVIARSRTDGV